MEFVTKIGYSFGFSKIDQTFNEGIKKFNQFLVKQSKDVFTLIRKVYQIFSFVQFDVISKTLTMCLAIYASVASGITKCYVLRGSV